MNRHDYRAHVAWSDSIRAERARPLPLPAVRHANRARARVTEARAPRRMPLLSLALAALAVLL